MEDLFLHTLQDIYYAENQIVKSLPKMIDKATNRNLATGLRDHLRETENQVMRLDSVFRKLGREPKGTDCPAIDRLIREADDVAGEVEDKKVLDAAIIGCAQAKTASHEKQARYPVFQLVADYAQKARHEIRCRLRQAGSWSHPWA